MSRLTFESVWYRFRSAPSPTLRDLNLQFENGLNVIEGPSGSGKSTLLALAVGDLRPTRGKVIIDSPEPRPLIAWVHQTLHVVPDLTVLENAMLGPLAFGQPRSLVKSLALEWLERLGLSGSSAMRGRTLSGGEAQRVAIARGGASGAEIVVVDEPTGSLDQDNAACVVDALAVLAEERLVVVATHDELFRSVASPLSLAEGALS